MAASRFWRLAAIYYEDATTLHLSELALYSAGSRVDGAATLSSSIAPSTGSLVALQDGDAETSCRFTTGHRSLSLTWDFGSPVDVDAISVRSTTQQGYISHAALQTSEDGVMWSDVKIVGKFPWPGTWADTGPILINQWSLVWTESFDTGIPGGFATTVTDSGTLVVAYNSTEKAVDLTATGYNTAWMFQGRAALGEWKVEMDVEVIDLDYGNFPHFGVAATPTSNVTQNLLMSAVRQVAVCYSSNSTPPSLQYQASPEAGFAHPTSGKSLRSVSMMASDVTMVRRIEFEGAGLVNAQFALTPVFAIPDANTWQLGLFIRSCKIRVHSISVYSRVAGTRWDPVFSRQAIPSLATSKYLAPIESAPKFKAPASVTRSKNDYNYPGTGAVKGVVVQDDNPDIPLARLVRLYREHDGVIVGATWSHPVTGEFLIENIDINYTYTAMSYDHEGQFIAVLQSGIKLRDPSAANPDIFYPNVVTLAELTEDFSDARGHVWTPTNVSVVDTGDGSKAASFAATSKLRALPGDALNFSDGDFTVEMYVYLLAGSSSSSTFLSSGDAAWGAGNCSFRLDANKLAFVVFPSAVVTGASNVPRNQWVHVAVTRRSRILRMTINGVLDYVSIATYNDYVNFSNGGTMLGSSNWGDAPVTGYIKGFRATAGARYNGAFTPPPLPMPRPA